MFVVVKNSSLVKNNGLIIYSICTLVNMSVLNTFMLSMLSKDGFLVLILGMLQRAKFDKSIVGLAAVGNQRCPQ